MAIYIPEVSLAKELVCSCQLTTTSAQWSGYFSLSTPTGGWTVEKAMGLEVVFWRNGTLGVGFGVYVLEIRLNGTTTYYFNASDYGPIDAQGVWTNEANAFDGNVTTSADVLVSGSETNNAISAGGTNVGSGFGSITSIEFRVYGDAGATPDVVEFRLYSPAVVSAPPATYGKIWGSDSDGNAYFTREDGTSLPFDTDAVETGTFTPMWVDASLSQTEWTAYTTRTGWYQKIGTLVEGYIKISGTAWTGLTTTDTAGLGPLPYISTSATNREGVAEIGAESSGSLDMNIGFDKVGYIEPSGYYIKFGDFGTVTTLTLANIAASVPYTLTVWFQYEAAL